MIKRHTFTDIFMHWFNAVCWLFLLATGLGLLQNEHLQLFGGAWSRWMRSLSGSGETLLIVHEVAGLIWMCGFLIYGIFRRCEVVSFARELLTVSPGRDLSWLLKKSVLMILGPGILKRFSIDPTLPDQGFYNVGQKLFAVPALLGGILIALSGITMLLSKIVITDTGWVQAAILVHFLMAGLVSAGLLIHIYMAALAPEERPALLSMFTGMVSEEYAKHHHRLWYDEVQGSPAPEDQAPPSVPSAV